jgi:hypothetical protein
MLALCMHGHEGKKPPTPRSPLDPSSSDQLLYRLRGSSKVKSSKVKSSKVK